MVATEEEIEAAGYTLAVVMRREIGHCDGWPNDHPGARSVLQDKQRREPQPPG
jgi:hypothetical protein